MMTKDEAPGGWTAGEQGQVDGRGEELADPGHQVRVLKAVGDDFARKRKRHGR